MGNLTTFTIYNDGIDTILTNPEGFCKALYDAVLSGEATEFGHGDHANLVIVQKTRHSSDPTIYVQMGNTLCEMVPYSNDAKKALTVNPEYFKNMVDLMDDSVRKLKEMYKNHKR